MDYSLFYNYKLIGDILMIVFNNDEISTRSERKDEDVVFIYNLC